MTAPSYEPILLFQKPLDGKNHENWTKHKTGMIDTRFIKTNILEVQKPSKKEKKDNPHYSVKPIDLLNRLVHGLCAKKVLDPFMGSGSTGMACKDIEFVGIELEKEFYDFANKRLS